MGTSLANIFTMEKLVVKIIFGSKSFILIFLWLFYDVWKISKESTYTAPRENQKDDESTLFPGGVLNKFWNDLLGLHVAKGKLTLHQHTTAYNTRCLGTA